MIPSTLAVASDSDWAIITDLAVILVSAAVVAMVMQPMRLAAIPALAAWAGSGATRAADTDVQLAGDGATLRFVVEAVVRVGGVAVLIVLGRVVLPRVLRESFKGRSLEVMTLTAVAAALLAAVVAQGMGFSLEMGAFLAGLMLAGTSFRHQLSGQIGPLRDIFIAVFFTTLGMELDPSIAAQWWWVIIAGGALMIVLKAALISGVCWALGTTASIAIAVGFSLAQAGEFSLIVLGAAHDDGVIDHATTAAAIAIVIISLILTPALVELGGRLARVASRIGTAPWAESSLLRDPRHTRPRPSSRVKHVIIAGYGPIGSLIAKELERAGMNCTVVELNPATVQEQSRRGRPVVFGDVGNLQVLESAGIGNAHALVLTIPDEEAVLRTCAVARRRAPGIFIAARTRVVSRRADLMEVGADSVTVDETSAATDMLRAVMACIEVQTEEGPLGTEPESDVRTVAESCDEDQ